MRKIKIYFHFYRNKFFIPLVFGVFILVFSHVFILAFISLMLASVGVWFLNHYIDDRKKQRLYFYFNQGISESKLYIFTFIINLAILIIINNIIK